jgi:deoxyuridine 5'-triphosphate nucleotidohydrolase
MAAKDVAASLRYIETLHDEIGTMSTGPLTQPLGCWEEINSLLLVQPLSDDAVLPTRSSELSAGLDITAIKHFAIPPRGQIKIPTDLAFAFPEGCYGRLAPRSSLAAKGIGIGGGVIDADFTGNVGVILTNSSFEFVNVTKGQRYAQLIVERIDYPEVKQVSSLPTTRRGAGGFGSTGS